jgi:hypothetical protein
MLYSEIIADCSQIDTKLTVWVECKIVIVNLVVGYIE